VRVVSPVGKRAANDAGPAFENASDRERRAADLFLADLLGVRSPAPDGLDPPQDELDLPCDEWW
jgi:hypothetical protein